MEFGHVSVLLGACIQGLRIDPAGIYVDGTLGGGGHALQIVQLLKSGRLIGIDQDQDALRAAGKRLAIFGDRFVPVHSNFSQLASVLEEMGIPEVDGVLLDLGVSSYQLDTPERGFSYMQDGALDMRMDALADLTAEQVVNTYSQEALTRVIRAYGEEKWAPRIAEFIVEARSAHAIRTTFELVDIIKRAVPASARRNGPHPAKRTFQAIRIEVNDELGIIERTIEAATRKLKPGGRIAIITFHSLEDRIVKQTFRSLSTACTCPPEFPICTCGGQASLRVITKRPIVPDEDEIERNPRARSAKLRIAEKL